MHRFLLFSSLSLSLALVACGGEEDPPVVECEGANGPCIEVTAEGDVQTAAQTALLEAVPGDVIWFRAGTYNFDRDLSLDIEGVTVRGDGMDETIFSFAEQTEGAQGMLVTADDIGFEDSVGDALKIEGATGVTIRRVRVEWTNGPSADNGAYGLYPVQCTDVLIEDSVAIAASDAGVYVGQSENVIVRRNTAMHNVAGIEIENTIGADVYDNVATENTGGLLIFNLPGLQLANGHTTRAYDNQIYNNNTDNFAPPGNIVGDVPKGTGIVILAGHNIEIFNNEIRDNQTASVAAISYYSTMRPFDDPNYDAFSDTVHIHDNTFIGGGDMPVGALGALVAIELSTVMDPVVVPSVVFDGMIHPDKVDAQNPGLFQAQYNICMQNNGDADFANVDFGEILGMVSLDAVPHDCAHEPLAAIVIDGVTP